MTFQEKRNKIEKLVLDVVKALDNKKQLNVQRYEMLFKTMTDEEFAKWAGSMGHQLDDTIQIFELPFEECSMAQIKKAADILGVPLEEYIWYRDKGDTPIRSAQKVPVGYVNIKRVQQMLNKKNRLATAADKRALKSGQVTGEDKVAAVSDLEAYCLLAVNADSIFEELYGPRADNYAKKADFYHQIAENGYADLSKLEDDITKHTTLNTLNTYLLASGIKTDLINDSLKTPFTAEEEINKAGRK
jgi:hypothetical protein